MLASETVALKCRGYQNIVDILPGQAVVIERGHEPVFAEIQKPKAYSPDIFVRLLCSPVIPDRAMLIPLRRSMSTLRAPTRSLTAYPVSHLWTSSYSLVTHSWHASCRLSESVRLQRSASQLNAFTFYAILTPIVFSCPFTRKYGHKARCHHPIHSVHKRPCLDRRRNTYTRNSCDFRRPGFQMP